MIRRIRIDVATALGLLTRCPIGWLMPANANHQLGRCGWCFPIVGAAIGGVAAVALRTGTALGMPQLLSTCWALLLSVLVTGGLHEDGLADAADGLGGGRTPEQRLRIMRDSRIGSYGTLALVLAVAIRLAAVGEMLPSRSLVALICGATASRFCILVVLAGSRAARTDGAGRAAEGGNAIASLIVGGGFTIGLESWLLPWPLAITTLLLSTIVGAGAAAMGRRMLGGYTGDILGAAAVVAECAVLTALTTGR